MRKNEIKYKNGKLSAFPYFLIAVILAALVVIAINI